MRFSYRELETYFEQPLPPVVEVAEALTNHSAEVEEVAARGDDWELEIKILPDRAADEKVPLGLARELSSVLNLPLKDEFVSLPTAKTARAKIIFSADDINHLLGVALGEHEITNYLKRVRVVVKEGEGHQLAALIPPERLDLNIKEDLADEVIRLHGYDKIATRVPVVSGVIIKPAANFVLANKIRAKLVGEGYTEIYGYTFTSHGEREVEKPLTSDKAWLRSNLKEEMKKVIKFNLGHVLFDKDEVKLFEIGTVFAPGGEEIYVAVAVGCKKPKLKIEVVEKKLSDFAKELADAPDDLDEFINKDVNYKSVSIYPRIIRDVALWVPTETAIEAVQNLIKTEAGKLLVEGPALFDEFQKGDQKSWAFRLVFQSYAKTLIDEEVAPIMAQITAKLEVNPSWQVRK